MDAVENIQEYVRLRLDQDGPDDVRALVLAGACLTVAQGLGADPFDAILAFSELVIEFEDEVQGDSSDIPSEGLRVAENGPETTSEGLQVDPEDIDAAVDQIVEAATIWSDPMEDPTELRNTAHKEIRTLLASAS